MATIFKSERERLEYLRSLKKESSSLKEVVPEKDHSNGVKKDQKAAAKKEKAKAAAEKKPQEETEAADGKD